MPPARLLQGSLRPQSPRSDKRRYAGASSKTMIPIPVRLPTMLRHRRIGVVTAIAVTLALHVAVSRSADLIPTRLGDHDFWTLLSTLSEPNGSFRSDNLLSNELRHQFVI